MSRTIVVTGGAGFIGSHIVHALLARGDSVRVLDDFSTGRRENIAQVLADVQLFEGDVRDEDLVARALSGADSVLHEAALPSVALSFERPGLVEAVNVAGTATVLGAARRQDVRRVVLASSCAVYGDAAVVPVGEDAATAPLSPYAVGKLAAEWHLWVLGAKRGGERPGPSSGKSSGAGLNGGVETVALRYFNVFGPRQDPSSEYSGVIARFMAAACTGQACTVYGDGLQSRDFVYVADVVAANLLALDAAGAVGCAMNVGSGVETTLLDLVAGIEAAAGVSLSIRHGAVRQGDIRRSCASISLARNLLGYELQTPLREGLAQTLEWYRDSVAERRG
jgi:nucleoside-diphosphate-sugar epimerase